MDIIEARKTIVTLADDWGVRGVTCIDFPATLKEIIRTLRETENISRDARLDFALRTSLISLRMVQKYFDDIAREPLSFSAGAMCITSQILYALDGYGVVRPVHSIERLGLSLYYSNTERYAVLTGLTTVPGLVYYLKEGGYINRVGKKRLEEVWGCLEKYKRREPNLLVILPVESEIDLPDEIAYDQPAASAENDASETDKDGGENHHE